MAMKLPRHKTEGVHRRYAIVSSGDLAHAARTLQAMARDNYGDDRRDWRSHRINDSHCLETFRAPSSVVEHVTFNHGVLGSIPRGPTI